MITLFTFKLNLNQLGIFTCTFILMVCDHIGHIYTFIFFIYVDSVYASLDLIFELICVCTVHIQFDSTINGWCAFRIAF